MDLKQQIILVLISIFLYIAYNLYTIFDPNKLIIPVNSSNCNKVKGIIGAEDIVKFKDFLLSSSDDRFSLWEDPELGFATTSNGEIYLINPKSENLKQVQIENFPADLAFHPHGIYLKSTTSN